MPEIGKRHSTYLINSRYPTTSDAKDGYFQRVKAVDDILNDAVRYYVNYGGNVFYPSIRRMRKNAFEIRTSKFNPLGLLLILYVTLSTDAVYFHSILRLRSVFHRTLFLLARCRVIDLHGAVPEELLLLGDVTGSVKFEKIEKFAINRSDVIVSVTNAMIEHIRNKHGISVRTESVELPIYIPCPVASRITKDFSKNIIYCGGLQKWQQVEKMLGYVHRHHSRYRFTFLVPDPDELMGMYRSFYGEDFPGLVESADSHAVKAHYRDNSFGLVLREDIVVNRVACPTKLSEYLQNDIVPIVDFEEVGDFKRLGYRYVRYDSAEFPDEEAWRKMAEENRVVLGKLGDTYLAGVDALRKAI